MPNHIDKNSKLKELFDPVFSFFALLKQWGDYMTGAFSLISLVITKVTSTSQEVFWGYSAYILMAVTWIISISKNRGLQKQINELTTPKFELTFEVSDDYIRFTPVNYSTQSGYYSQSSGDAYYVRVKLKNLSSVVIKNVQVRLVDVKFLKNGIFEKTVYADQLLLGDQKEIIEELLPDTEEYVDILSINDQDKNIHIESKKQLFKYVNLFKEPGTYRIDIKAVASNAKSMAMPLEITHDRSVGFVKSNIKACAA